MLINHRSSQDPKAILLQCLITKEIVNASQSVFLDMTAAQYKLYSFIDPCRLVNLQLKRSKMVSKHHLEKKIVRTTFAFNIFPGLGFPRLK